MTRRKEVVVDKMDYWRLCDQLSIIQAALLVLGEDPSEQQSYVLSNSEQDRPDNFTAVFTALTNAVICKKLKAEIHFIKELRLGASIEDDCQYETENPDWDLTIILVDDLKTWLRGRGFKMGFFFPEAAVKPDFLDANHEKYSPKLAVAIGAWEAVNAESNLTRGKTVKQALMLQRSKTPSRYEGSSHHPIPDVEFDRSGARHG